MRIVHKGIFLIALPLIFQFVFFVALIVALGEQESTVDSQIALAERRLLTYKVLSECHAAVLIVTSDTIAPDAGVFGELKEKEKRAFKIVEELRSAKLTEKEAVAFKRLSEEVKKYFVLMSGAVQLHDRNNVKLSNDEKLGFYGLLEIRMKNLSGTVEPLFQSQAVVENRFVRERDLWTIIGVLATILLSAGTTFAFSRGFVTRIKHLKENSLRLARGEALLPSLKGTDEIAELDSVFHNVASSFSESYKRELAMFDSAADLIFCLNSAGQIERVNQILRSTLGYDPEAAINSDIRSYIDPADIAQVDNFLEAVKSNKGKRQAIEVHMISSEGESFQYQWSVRWEPSHRTFYCVAHDITERKRMEQAKQEFVAMLSHDLRTPLTSLGLTIEMVVDGSVQKMPERCVNVFSMAQRSIARLVNLISELLDLEKLEAGEMEVSPSVVPIASLFESALDSLRMSASERGIELESVDNGLTVSADQERVVRVLINLLSNAIKYSKSGDKVVLSAEHTQTGFIEITVTDEGPGIPHDKLQNIFERYKQVQDAEKIHKQGSGLGLSICKAIVEAHGGTIGVKSILGSGSQFWFRLPEGE